MVRAANGDKKPNPLDLLAEDVISIANARKQFPGDPSPATVWRWAQRGVRSVDGGRVKLEIVRSGGKTYTSLQAITRFIAAQQVN